MEQVHAVFAAFDHSAKAIADATGFPLSTVWDWQNGSKPDIPPWRRPAVLDAARRLGKQLPPDATAYLLSSERPAKAKAAA